MIRRDARSLSPARFQRPRRSACALLASALVTITAHIPAAHAQVVLHNQSPAGQELTGVVSTVDASGILVLDAADAKTGRLIGWDRIRAVNGPDAAKAAPFLDLSDRLWRARTRLERGDWLAAAPILKDLAASEKGHPGPTSAVVFDGLLRCELARGARAGALTAWFDWLISMEKSGAIKDAGVARPANWVGGTIDAPSSLAIVIDPKTALVPMLPPIWVGETAIDAAASSAQWDALLLQLAPDPNNKKPAAPITTAYLQLYLAAAKAEAGQSVQVPETGPQSSGARLVRLIVLARCGDAKQREVGRAGLATLAKGAAPDGPEPWVESWCRAGIGRSLIKEPDPVQRMRGVLELLHIPARFSQVTPDLAAVAIAEAASTLWDLGDHAGAAVLKAELLAQHPGHPAAQWTGLDKIKSVAAPKANREALPDQQPAHDGTTPARGKKGGNS